MVIPFLLWNNKLQSIFFSIFLIAAGLVVVGCGGTPPPPPPATAPAEPTPVASPSAESPPPADPATAVPETVTASPQLRPEIRGVKMGYVDQTGEWVIEPKFEGAQDFAEGVASVSFNGKWGYIDPTGQFVIEPQFDYADNFSEGLAAVVQEGKWGFIDSTGQFAVEPQYDGASRFSEGLAVAYVAGQGGFINPSGGVVIPFQFQAASNFSEGLAAVSPTGKWGYVDPSGKMVVEAQYDFANDFSEGLAAVTQGSQSGYIDPTGQVVIPVQFNYASNFSEGLAPVALAEKWGYVNPAGELVIEPQFMGAFEFSEGLAAVNVAEKWGYVDPTGKMVIEPQFYFANPFKNGLAFAGLTMEDRVYIDPTGQVVTQVKPIEQVVIGETITLTTEQVTFSYEGLANKVQGQIMPANPIAPGPPALESGSPAYLRFTFDDDSMSEWFWVRERQLLIFPVAEYQAVFKELGGPVDTAEALKGFLAGRPETIQGGIPFLPPIPAAQVFQAQVEYLEFQNGSGVRFITQYAQDAGPVTNDAIFYTFQGITADGAYYIALFYPVSASILPASYEETPIVEDYEKFAENYVPYIQETTQALDTLEGADYTPDLALLDNMIQSLQITTTTP
jgi:hypothetical protein